MSEFSSRTEMLIGHDGVEKLRRCHVCVFGVGGVGSFTAEALARAGVGAITLVDPDIVAESNLNRQLVALHSTVGMNKADVMAARIRDINPGCAVTALPRFYAADTADGFDIGSYSYIVDAIDTVSSKLLLIERAKKAGVEIISCMGAGNKLDPTAFVADDISRTQVCPLARVMRRELRARGIESLRVVYSKEPPVAATAAREDTRKAIPGSVAFVPSVAGLILAGEVIKGIALP